MRLLGLFLVIILMTACGESESTKEKPADPAQAEEMETPAETAPAEEGDQSPGQDADAVPDELITPPSDEK